MRILLINHYAGSLRHGMEYRPFYLSREWARLGHEVTIAAASFAHVRTEEPVMEGDVTEEEIEGIRYLWFRTPRYHGNGVRRAMNMFAFTRQLARYREMLSERCEGGAVIASSTYPLDAYPGRWIAKRAKARFVFEVHDLWPLTLIELGGMSRFHPFIVLLQRAETYAYRHADCVVSMLPDAEGHMRSHGLEAGKFYHVPNGIDATEWSDGEDDIPLEHREVVAAARHKGHMVAMYAGAHGIANALECLIHAAAKLKDLPVTVVLVGKGPDKPALQQLARDLGLTNVLFLPSVKKSSIPALLRTADFLIISMQRCSLYRFGISPNKLFDYMMAGKPIIQAAEASNDLVTDSGCGITIPPSDPQAMANAVRRLMALNDAERTGMGMKGNAYVNSRHTYPVLAKTFLKLLGATDPCTTKSN